MSGDTEFDFCLLIPCYNNFPGLVHSIQSVVYPAERFCIVVVDDGSREVISAEKVKSAIDSEMYIVVLRNENNLGITGTLNKGLAWIDENVRTQYIARLDCGDTCHATRFTRQMTWMQNNAETALLGSWCYFRQKDTGEQYVYRTPVEHSGISKEMYFRNAFIHPTVMFRKSVLKVVGFYPTAFEYAEDYAFFWRIIRVFPCAILDECLVTCEINKSGISYQNKSKQLMARWRVVNAFGSNLALKFVACARLMLLFIIPRQLTLQFKKWKT